MENNKTIIPKSKVKNNEYLNTSVAVHAAMLRKAIKPLYSWTPVFRVINLYGLDTKENTVTLQEAELIYKVEHVIGGNSPVARSFFNKDNDPVIDVEAAQYDDNGNVTYRRVKTGANDNSDKHYSYIPELVLVKFRIKDADTAKVLSERVLSEGLTINGTTVVIGQTADGQKLNPYVWSPSNERSGQIIFTGVDSVTAWNKLEAIGGGAMSRKLAGEMSIAKFKKIASRLGLFATPAVEFVTVGNKANGLLVLDHELEGSDDFDTVYKKALANIGISIDKKQWDGAAFFSDSLALEGLKNLGAKHVGASDALMFAFQLRVSQVYAKVFGEALHQSVMNKISRFIIAELDKLAAASNKSSKDYYRVYGNPNNISMILDSNAAKIVDLTQDAPEDGMQVYLLDIAKPSKSRTSTQMMSKFALMDAKRTAEFMRNKAKADSANYADGVGSDSINLLSDNINVWQTLLSVAKEMPADSKTAMDIYGDENIMARLLADVSRRHESAYKKCAIEIDSMFERALFDSSYLLTDGKVDSLLKTDDRGAIECFSNDVLEMFAEEIAAIEEDDSLTPEQKKELLDKKLTASMIKYPTPGTEEIAVIRPLTAKELRARIAELVANGVIDEATAKVLWNYFCFTSYGVIKIAADNALKHKLAGMDTDYDGVVVILEQELNAILLDVYAKRKAHLEETTGLIAPHTGTIPYIDSSKDAVDLLAQERHKALYGDEEDADDLAWD